MPTESSKKLELSKIDIAIALLSGGLSFEEMEAVVRSLRFEKSVWDSSPIINIYNKK
jgi:hypothetical protein